MTEPGISDIVALPNQPIADGMQIFFFHRPRIDNLKDIMHLTMRGPVYLFALMLAAGIGGCSTDLPPTVSEAYHQLPEKIDYNVDVKPILSDKCFSCHGPDKAKQKAGLRLDIADNAYAELSEHPGKVAIDPGNPEESELFSRIMSDDPDYLMPTPSSHYTLSAYEKAVLCKWIEQGARYKPHWAFVVPIKPEVPAVSDSFGTSDDPIDHFIWQKLAKEKLHPAAEAPKEVLLRRLYLDLTGLPPTIGEIDAFLNDRSADAYGKQVDKLLASPHYGEKMAVDWLDVARFADSHGYTVDRIRDMSAYRDWVINAFNGNMRYDRFMEEQLAGDLMPNPTRDMIIATAFNRNHPQNMEGGVVEKEFQTEYVIDRTNTFGSAFLGLTVGCAKCHDHKFDPISQKNYYELFSFFNNVREAGQISFNDDMPSPTILLPSQQKERLLRLMQSVVDSNLDKETGMRISKMESAANWIKEGRYKTLGAQTLPLADLDACYTFDQGSLQGSFGTKEPALMKRETGQQGDNPVYIAGAQGKGLKLSGDTWLDLRSAGVYNRSQPFTVGIWVNIPKDFHEGVIFHKSQAERLFNFKGYHLYLKNDRFELSMAHAAPSNAISRVSLDSIPRDQWIQLTCTYDGSSRASGLNLYLNGAALKLNTVSDQLTKDILFIHGDLMTSDHKQPGLQVGAWWRGLGFKGGGIDDIVCYHRQLTPFEIDVLAKKKSWRTISETMPAKLSTEETVALQDYYFSAVDPDIRQAADQLRHTRDQLSDSTENVDELMVMQEMKQPKKAHILLRGNYDAPGDEVSPNTPASILSFSKDLPRNRYGLAQWLIDPANPLTARVAVNRIWQNFFGTGITKTSEDFGNQGEMPSHPELLDWLACTFRESGWDVKKLVRLVVLSDTYRQSSIVDKSIREKDPENRLLARGPSGRMTAEMIRDNALEASGLLNEKIGGKSVKPYQPDGLWEINNTSYQRDSGDALYRRSLYVIIKRSVPNPTLATFDAGSRSYCIIRRQPTNTPLQALVTLNDPTFVEAARVLGEQITRQRNTRTAVTNVYRQLTGQKPTDSMLDLLMDLQRQEKQIFTKAPEKMKGWLHEGVYTVSGSVDPVNVAANAVVASTIINSDASLSKR